MAGKTAYFCRFREPCFVGRFLVTECVYLTKCYILQWIILAKYEVVPKWISWQNSLWCRNGLAKIAS